MEAFYATFGTGHGYSGCYVEILAEDQHCARLFMMTEHGDRWAALYTQDEFPSIGRKYNLHKLATVRQRPGGAEDRPFFDLVRSEVAA